MRVEDPKRPRVTLLFTSSAITCPPRRALLLDSTSPASFTPTCTTRDGALLMRVALWDSKVGRCREAPMKPAVASTKSSDERNNRRERREPASKTVRVMTIEGARLPAASKATRFRALSTIPAAASSGASLFCQLRMKQTPKISSARAQGLALRFGGHRSTIDGMRAFEHAESFSRGLP